MKSWKMPDSRGDQTNFRELPERKSLEIQRNYFLQYTRPHSLFNDVMMSWEARDWSVLMGILDREISSGRC